MNSAHAEVTSGSSSAEYGKQVSTEFGVKGSYGAFDGAAQASLESISTQRHKQYRRTSNIKFRHQHMSLDVFEPWSLLSPAAKKFLLNAPIDRLHDRLGDFYALEITLGGVFQQTTIATMFEGEESFQAEARIQASYDAIVAAADISFSKGGISTKKQGNETFESRLKALGGDTSIFLKLNGHNREDLQIEWANSFRDHENDFPVGFRLAPIWDLLDSEDMNPAKAQELKRLMTDKWSSVTMPNFPGIPHSDVEPVFTMLEERHFPVSGNCLMRAQGASSNLPVDNSPYTIEAWVMPDANVGNGGIVSYGDRSTGRYQALRFYGASGLHAYWWSRDLSSPVLPSLADGQWHHVATTWDGQTRRILVDFVEVARNDMTGFNVVRTDNFCVGSSNELSEPYRGRMRGLKIWTVARSGNQMSR